MAKANYPPYSAKDYPLEDPSGIVIGIVITEWNADIISNLLKGARATLVESGINQDNISIHAVPGSFEIPLGVKLLLSSTLRPDAVICLGCVIQGETKHDDYINHTVARAISTINLASSIPVIFGLLTTNNEAQALERSGGSHGNKGEESAIAALKMLSLKEKLIGQGKKISF